MNEYTIRTTQAFDVEYVVIADSWDDAWEKLIAGESEPTGEQFPGEIIGAQRDAVYDAVRINDELPATDPVLAFAEWYEKKFGDGQVVTEASVEFDLASSSEGLVPMHYLRYITSDGFENCDYEIENLDKFIVMIENKEYL